MASHVNIILARDVLHLGHLGEIVKVRPGFARNFLFPKLLALPVSSTRVKHFEHQKKLIEHQRQRLRTQSEELGKKLAEIQITLLAKVGEQGKLFGSIGTRDIEKALIAHGHPVSHRDIKLESPIKTVGLHVVEVRLEGDVKAKVNLVVVPDVAVTEAAVPAANDASNEDL
ncbi:MAG: 50S ribosomal protein L9 [Myxococcaceae bacterium]